jgi:putative ABC transport system permease protein
VILAIVLMALREIRRNAMRSMLTGLGIVIGVAAVIAMVSLGESATQKVTSDVAKLGNNMLTVMPGGNRRGPGNTESAPPFTLADADAIRKQTAAALVAPAAGKSLAAIYGNKNHQVAIQGSTVDFFGVRDLRPGRGRFFNEAEAQAGLPVCVIGATVQRELFGSQEPLGESLRLGRLTCRVVGVAAAKGQSTFGQDQDDFIVLPLVTFQRRVAGSNDVTTIAVSAKSAASSDRVKSQIIGLLRERRRVGKGQSDDFTVMDMKEFAASLGSITGALTALLGAIAAVSLLVGGIGIMNIMLVSVTERTREIGIRMAIGARSEEVLFQFLVEAVMLSTLGGVVGIALGLFGSWAGARGLGMSLVVSPGVLVLAFGFSASVGIAFGFFPARRAARLRPIDALRHE